MAKVECNPFFSSASNQSPRQEQLFLLISQLCAPRSRHPQPDVCRLVVDSRLQWAVAPIDGESSWLYLPEVARARHMAGCLVLSAA